MILNDILIWNLCILITKSLEGVHDVCVYIINVKIWLHYTKKERVQIFCPSFIGGAWSGAQLMRQKIWTHSTSKPYVNFLSSLISKVLSLLFSHSLQKKCLLATKNLWRTQKTLSKNLICDGKILQYLEIGSEPSPIDCFKKFHTKKDGKEWATDHTKALYVCNLYQSFNFVINFSFFVVLIIHMVFIYV